MQKKKRTTAKKKQVRPDLDHVIRVLRAQLPELRERYHIRTLGIFGSYVRGKQKKRSDLLVDFDEAPDLFEFIDLEQDLVNLLGVKVDIVTRGTLRGNIGQRILREVRAV